MLANAATQIMYIPELDISSQFVNMTPKAYFIYT